jgi:multidrug resistance efflux pump
LGRACSTGVQKELRGSIAALEAAAATSEQTQREARAALEAARAETAASKAALDSNIQALDKYGSMRK